MSDHVINFEFIVHANEDNTVFSVTDPTGFTTQPIERYYWEETYGYASKAVQRYLAGLEADRG